VREPRRDVDLAPEPLRAERHAEVGVQHLDRDLQAGTSVEGKVHRRHAAAAELAFEHVAVAEHDLSCGERCRHRAVSPRASPGGGPGLRAVPGSWATRKGTVVDRARP
jgi:hypothetical protein